MKTLRTKVRRLSLLVLAMLGTGTIACLPAAHATYSGKNGVNGKIVYVAPGVGGNTDIYSIKPDGTHKRQLTHTNANEYAPTFSPLGRIIAFQRGSNIFRMWANGTSVTLVGPGANPTFSRDGETIGYTGPGSEIYKMRALDGGGVHQVTDQPNSGAGADEASWGKSGRIAYVQCCPDEGPGGNGGETLWEVRPTGASQKTFGGQTIEGWSPDWAPDGSRIVYTGYGPGVAFSLFVIKKDGSNNHMVLAGTNAVDYEDGVWSPSGTKFLLVARPDGMTGHLAIVNKNGTGIHKVPHTKGASSPVWQPR
jgi:Tol biopolymer transport system component